MKIAFPAMVETPLAASCSVSLALGLIALVGWVLDADREVSQLGGGVILLASSTIASMIAIYVAMPLYALSLGMVELVLGRLHPSVYVAYGVLLAGIAVLLIAGMPADGERAFFVLALAYGGVAGGYYCFLIRGLQSD